VTPATGKQFQLEARNSRKDAMNTQSKQGLEYDFFHIGIHGTVMIHMDQSTNKVELRIPYNGCHYYVAACLDEDGDVVAKIELERETYVLSGLESKASFNPILPDPERLMVAFPGAHGPHGWCKVAGLPWPEKISPWRHFPKKMLDTGSQTYQDNALDLVDERGVPVVYILHYGSQTQKLALTSTKKSLSITPTRGVGRLHIYAEGKDSMQHDAISTLNACATPPFDIAIRGCTPNEPPNLDNPPDDTLAYNEQFSLEEQIKRQPGKLAEFTALPCCPMGSSLNPKLGRPRTCTSLISLQPVPTELKHVDRDSASKRS
jgi:hypothetical protein